MNSPVLNRREFLQTTTSLGVAAVGGWLCPQAWAGEPLNMRVGARDLRVLPVLTYQVSPRQAGRSWRPWGDIQTEEAAEEELARIRRELADLARRADFGLQPLAPVKVRSGSRSRRWRQPTRMPCWFTPRAAGRTCWKVWPP